MTVIDQIIQQMEELPPRQQREVLEYITSLRQLPTRGLDGIANDPEGLLSDQDADLDLQSFAEARRAVWDRWLKKVCPIA